MDKINKKDVIKGRLKAVYRDALPLEFAEKFLARIEIYKSNNQPSELWNEKDVFLITYGDSLLKEDERPLQTLNTFVREKLKEAISIVHILPFFPYSSDDGFSVIDFTEVDPKLGNWSDIQEISSEFKMMADLVVNHISAKSDWMQQFLKGEKPGKDFILTVGDNFDASQVVRPRSSPLFTPFETPSGTKNVWTTFSDDQIDLNYNNPELLLEMIEILLSYVQKGISVIRLDAIAFLWKRSGTSCLHQEETHEVVKIMRDVFDYCVPGTVLLTETNVPHKENISYFGKGDEAHMVYQFSLPPLLLHALHTSNAFYLTQWAARLGKTGDNMTFFNFTASHDGIGVRPLEGLLPDDEKARLFEKMKAFGGRINTRRTVEGEDVPYELNITYYDALRGTQNGKDKWQQERFICSQTIMMTMQGIPAIYIHSLLGTHNYQAGVEITGQNRTINRRKWDEDEISSLLTNPNTDHAIVFNELVSRLKIRRNQKAFHPEAHQEIIDAGSDFFIVHRLDLYSLDEILSVSNITAEEMEVNLSDFPFKNLINDLISGKSFHPECFVLQPYQTVWLTK